MNFRIRYYISKIIPDKTVKKYIKKNNKPCEDDKYNCFPTSKWRKEAVKCDILLVGIHLSILTFAYITFNIV